jgi:hypothetical protein
MAGLDPAITRRTIVTTIDGTKLPRATLDDAVR